MDLPIQTMKILKNSEYFNDVFSKWQTLVGGLEHVLFSIIYGIILPID